MFLLDSPERVFYRGDFGVVAAGLFVPTLADYLAALHDDCADSGIRPCVPQPAARKLVSAIHELRFILLGFGRVRQQIPD